MEAEGYFDYAGSAPPFPEALEVQRRAAAQWYANPSAAHGAGRAARAEYRRLKAEFCGLCGFDDGRLIVTSGATEANNLVIRGVLAARPDARVLVAPDVHASVWNTCQAFAGRVDVLPLDANGHVTLAAVAGALREQTALVCVSHAANETGVVHDVAALCVLCERRGVLSLVDGSQALGHLPFRASEAAFDFYTFSAHKFGGPRGCGGILCRSNRWTPVLSGGPQEGQMRPGTENLPGLAGTLEALRRSLDLLPSETPRLRGLARSLMEALRASRVAWLVNGDPESGLPGFVSLSFPGLEGQSLVAELALRDQSVATGSACHADQPVPSRAVLALGRTPREAQGTVRVSMGRLTTEDDVRRLAALLIEVVQRQKALAPA